MAREFELPSLPFSLRSMSSGFELSSLLDRKRKAALMFTSQCLVSAIMAKLESLVKGLSFRVVKVKDVQVRLQGCLEVRKGRLSAIVCRFYRSSFRVVSCSFMASPAGPPG
ncbi:hypothetical protein TIFTF001_034062 [Ficus carica]|uniref:NAF domain-containing protein n=1 Tax=Ficus carica TaxID=3494 RepID=A0AA88E230_FICCA|nr:hypothetical protein TIFTF001_034062 [Ficus carica]